MLFMNKRKTFSSNDSDDPSSINRKVGGIMTNKTENKSCKKRSTQRRSNSRKSSTSNSRRKSTSK